MCGGEYYVENSESMEITSPLYPQNYPDNVACIYKLVVDSGRLVRLTMDELATPDSLDIVDIYDGYYVDERFKLASLSVRLSNERTYTSTVNAITVRFTTNANDNDKGFKAHFESVQENAVSTVTVTSTTTALSTIISATSVTITSTTTHTSTITSATTETSTITKTITPTDTLSPTPNSKSILYRQKLSTCINDDTYWYNIVQHAQLHS